MKKILSLALALALTLTLAACTGTPASSNVEGELPELMNKVLEAVDLDADTKDWLKTGLAQTELTAENTEYFLGKADYGFEKGLAAEPQMSAQALSIILLRTKDAAGATKLAEEVKATVNPRKWICVGVEPTDVKTATIGNLMILVMAENSDKYIDSFNALTK